MPGEGARRTRVRSAGEVTEGNGAARFAATIRSPIAPMHAEPSIASQMISQQLAGHRVDVLDEDGDWVCARGADGYDGWMHVGFIARAANRPAEDGRRVSLGCVARTQSGVARALPLHALLSSDETVVSGEAVDVAHLRERFPCDAHAIAQTAKEQFTGTSYLWGGVTPWGADCSGLVQTAFALHGIQLPRDAWQQAEQGSDAGGDVGELVAGDLLFFSDRADRRITHVGVSLGKRRMVHLALNRGGYAIELLSDRRDPYVQRLRERFICARRIAQTRD